MIPALLAGVNPLAAWIPRSGAACLHFAVVLLTAISLPLPAATVKQRDFDASESGVWAAAADVVHASFFLENAAGKDGTMRFRTGPAVGFRFEVSVLPVTPKKTRVILRLRNARVPALQRVAWHSGDKFLDDLASRLRPPK